MMGNINQMEVTVQKDRNFLYKFGYPVLLFSLLNFNNLAQAHPYTSVDKIMTKTDILSGDFLSQLDDKLGVKLPQGYDTKVRNMLETNVVMKDEYSREFTQDFIIREMKKDRGISKQNQLLFIWSAIYFGMEEKELYDGEDGDEKRLSEFEIAVDMIENCGSSYMEQLKMYIGQGLEEGKQRLEEGKQRLEEGKQRLEEGKQELEEGKQGLEEGKQRLEEGKQRLEEGKQRLEEGKQRLEEGKQRLEEGKQRLEEGKQELEKGKQELGEGRQRLEEGRQRLEEGKQRLEEGKQELGEGKQELEEGKQRLEEGKNQIQQNISQIMSLDSAGLKSLNNIYNLYKKDPSSVTSGELEQARKSAAHIISDCKKYGIDYKKLLSLEVRRFYGIE